MARDHTDQLLTDLDEARKKKKKRHDSPKTPHGSPPHQPPPPPPLAVHLELQELLDHLSSSKTAASVEYTAWMTTDTRLKLCVSSIPKELHMDDDTTLNELIQSSSDEDIGHDHITTASALASTYAPPPENSLLAQTGDMAIFMYWFCKKQGITKLKQQDLEGPAYEIVKVFHLNSGRHALSILKMKAAYYPDVGLEQMVLDQIHTSEGDRRAVRTHMRILSVVKIEVFSLYRYDYMKKIVLRRADLKEYTIAERDFKYLYPSDFEDQYLLNLQGHLDHLPPGDKKILTTAVNLWTRNLVIRQRVEDFQLGIESYETQLNLTKPRWDATGFEFKHDFTIIDCPRAVTFRDKYGVQMIMRFNEIYKFSDDTLQQINEALDYRIKEFKTAMELVLEHTQQGSSNEVSDYIKMLMQKPLSSKVKFIATCSYSRLNVIITSRKIDLKLPHTLISTSSSVCQRDEVILKGKNVVEKDVRPNNPNVIAPGMFKLDLAPLAPKLLNNRDAHIYYIKHSREHADILHEIVEHARALRPLDSDLDSACKIVQRIQDVLVYVRDTCLSLTKPSEKLVAVTPLNKNKKVRFAEAATLSRMKSSTNASRSQPSCNTKNNRILQTTSSNMKNKVEDHPRSVNSKSNKMNRVIELVCNANVKHTMLNANSELICVKCMFDANHDVYFLEFVNDVNVRSKSKSAKKSKNKNIWKPTGKVFTDIGYRWKPTGRIFTIAGNTSPLTMITSIKVAPLKKTTSKSVTTQNPQIKVDNRRPNLTIYVGSSSKSKVVVSKISNNSEPNQSWGSNVSDVPSTSLIDFRLSKLFCGIWTSDAPRLVPNPPSATPYVPPNKDCDTLFHPMFDEYFNTLPRVASLVPTVVAPDPADSTKEFYDIEVAHLDNDPFFGVPIPEPNSKESSSRDVIPTNVHSINQKPKHLSK
ncbi:hypothetical protein Tco_0637940 [Tanacetum coccineum]